MSLKICGGTSLSGSWDMPVTRSDCFTLTKKGLSKLCLVFTQVWLIKRVFAPKRFHMDSYNQYVRAKTICFKHSHQRKCMYILNIKWIYWIPIQNSKLNFWLYYIRFYLSLEEPTFKSVQKIVMFTTQPNLSWMEKHQKAQTFLCLFRTHVS